VHLNVVPHAVHQDAPYLWDEYLRECCEIIEVDVSIGLDIEEAVLVAQLRRGGPCETCLETGEVHEAHVAAAVEIARLAFARDPEIANGGLKQCTWRDGSRLAATRRHARQEVRPLEVEPVFG
jgi:hypothetical protein